MISKILYGAIVGAIVGVATYYGNKGNKKDDK